MILWKDSAPYGVETRIPLADFDGLEFVDPAPPGEAKILSPDQKYFHISTTPTHLG